MAGLNCGIPSLIAWDFLKNGTDISISIKDSFAEEAIRQFYFPEGDDVRITTGESGAAGLAGFLSIISDPEMKIVKEALKLNKDSRILFINTEGATDPEAFERIIRSK
jgi:diaminopropionate ammonia-lyase